VQLELTRLGERALGPLRSWWRPVSAKRVYAVVPQSGAERSWWRPVVAATRAFTDDVASPSQKPSLAFGALVAFTFILLLAPQERFTFLGPLHLAVLTSVLAAAALVYHRMLHRQRVLARGSSAAWALGLGAWSVLTIPFSMWPGGSFQIFTSLYFKSIVIFLLLGAIIDSAARLRRLAWALTLFALPLALTALANYAGHKFVAGQQTVERIIGYQAGLSENPNDLALLLNLILPLTAALFLSHQGTIGRVVLAVAMLLDACAVVATFSRAGFLTLAFVSLGLMWKWRRRRERVWTWAALALALVSLLLLPAGYLEHLATITNISADTTGSAQERSRDMLLALDQISERPFVGAGLGQNVLALNAERGATWRMVHNVYLQYAVDLGVPGLMLFLALFWSCLSGLRRSLRSLHRELPGSGLFDLAGGVQLSLVAFALAAFFHPAGYTFPFFYIAGLAVAVRAIALRTTT